MEQRFWTDRWAEGQTGWHASRPNPFLVKHLPRLGCASGEPILVPLCGKTLDLSWLEQHAGLRPIGVEWAEHAVEEFFREHELAPTRSRLAEGVEHWEAAGIEILCADWFQITSDLLNEVAGGPVRAWWDRASLIALPPELRERYARHLAKLLPSGARGLLLSLEYPPEEKQGPPFSVDPPEVRRLFAGDFVLEELEWEDALPRDPRRQAQGMTRLHERLYRLERK